MNKLNLKDIIKNAEKHNACEDALAFLKQCKTVEEAKNHPEAPYWPYWYAENVIKGRWFEGEDIIKSDPYWREFYTRDVIGEQKGVKK